MTGDHVDEQGRAATVFVSYARADRAFAERLVEALEDAGHDVWWDRLIEGGAGFSNLIEEKLNTADAVVVIWSATSIASDWVRDEAGHGRDRGRLISVSIGGALPPLGFRQYHCVDLDAWSRGREPAAFGAVLAGIGKAAGAPAPARPPGAVIRKTWPRRAVIGTAVGTALGAGGLLWLRPWAGKAGETSVAVLPFSNLSGDPGQRYFSDGLAEDVRAALARTPSLQVAAPTSSNMFRDTNEAASSIAAKLGVAYLLQGSVRRSGNVVRISAGLIEASSGLSRWGESFDRRLDDIFAVQSEIATTVAGALVDRIAPTAQADGGTRDVAAYDAFLRGQALFGADSDEASDRAALALFDQAVARDASYAAAHAARSRVLSAQASGSASMEEARRLYDQAIAAARQSVKLSPRLAPALLALGLALYTGQLDIAAARDPYRQAAALAPGDADIQLLFAIYASRTGMRHEAVIAADAALKRDPLNARAARAAGVVRFVARDFDAAIMFARKALALNPKLRVANANIGAALLMQNRAEQARDAFRAEELDLVRLPGLAIAERKLGNLAAANMALATLVRELGDGGLYQQAQVFAQWGDPASALDRLARARAAGDAGLLMAATDPLLDPVRTGARFRKILGTLYVA